MVRGCLIILDVLTFKRRFQEVGVVVDMVVELKSFYPRDALST